jgi:superfamily II DNA or RNA helicase
MKKKQNIPSAFEDVLTGLGYDNPENTGEVTNTDQQDTFADVEPLIDKPGPKTEPVEEKKEDDSVKTQQNDDADIPEEVLARMNGQKVDNEPDSTDDNADDEPTNAEVIEAFNNSKDGVLHSSKACNTGLDLKGVNLEIILNTYSSKIKKIQTVGRSIRFEPGKMTEVFTLVLRGTQELN